MVAVATEKHRQWDRRFEIALANALPIIVVLVVAAVQAVNRKGFYLPFGSVSAQVRELLWFAAACGFGSYATIETLKRVFRVRGRYQRWRTTRWLDERPPARAYEQLLGALGLDPDEALRVFDLPTEQLAAQVGTAADIALANPAAYPDLVARLAAPLPHELHKYLDRNGPSLAHESAQEDRFQLAQRLRVGVDRLQISLGEQWKRVVQGAAVWIAGGYGIGLAYEADVRHRAQPTYVITALLIGGAIAWLVRDLAAVVERARR